MRNYSIETIVAPGFTGNVSLQRYIIDSDDKAEPRRPVIVCPGGGYFMISSTEGDPVCRRYIEAGYAPFILNYSIMKEARFDRDMHPPIKAVSDLAAAAEHIISHSSEYHVDTDRLVFAGFSAGGHVLATYLGEATGPMPELVMPHSALLVYPLIEQSVTAQQHSEGTVPPREPLPDDMRGLIRYYMFGSTEPSPEDLAAFDAATGVNGKWPRLFLYHSRTDQLVPFESSVRLDGLLSECGVEHRFYMDETGVHAKPFERTEWWDEYIRWENGL